MMSWWLLSPLAHGFCGTFVGAPGADLRNRASQVVLAREGDRTTLTLVADYQGDLDQFAMIVPVPPDLDPESVQGVAAAHVDRLDRYSTPRRVSYTCDDAVTYEHAWGNGPGCALMFGGCANEFAFLRAVEPGSAEMGVTVQAAFTVAEYDVALLSAIGAEGLQAWLASNGFAVPAGGAPILQEYIDGGVAFLAAKVTLTALDEAPRRLTPLQLSYVSPFLGLPVRIGTINATGVQEVLLYAITDDSDVGQVEILNYPEVVIEDDCMWRADPEASFEDYYRDQLEVAAGPARATWVTEYAWPLLALCDPCTVPLEELYQAGDLAPLGFDGYHPYLTRIRMTYAPDAVPEDLVLGALPSPTVVRQMRFIEYDRQLEFLFPVCGEGYVDDPGQCGDDGTNPVRLGSSLPAPVGLLGFLVLIALRRTR